MGDLPGSVLFACNRNIIRSPIAEGLMKHLLGHRVYVDSVGVRLSSDETDPFAIAAVAEIGLDISDHQPKTFEEAADHSIDLIVTFTPQAHHWALDLTRTLACDVEYWPMADPTLIEGNRETRLAAYRQLRDDIFERIKHRFPSPDAALD